MNPSPFEIAQNTGNQFAKGVRGAKESNALDQVLQQVSSAKTPEEASGLIGNILQNVSKEKQPMAMKIIENKLSELKGQRTRDADIAGGLDPNLVDASPDVRKANLAKQKEEKDAITLTQQLAQVEKRYQTKTKAKRLPFEKTEFGQTFLDLDKIDKDKSDVLIELKKDLDIYTQQVAREYEKAGVPVPQDVLDDIKAINQVKVDNEMVDLEVAIKLQEVTKKFPPAKYKGKTATDPETGKQIISDGVKWSFVEEIQEGA